jgi:hypothetical protein
VPKLKEKPFQVPSLNALMLEVTNDERIQMEAANNAIGTGMLVGKLCVNWCPPCGRWRLQFVSAERAKTVQPNETFLCTKCGTPIKLILDRVHVLAES